MSEAMKWIVDGFVKVNDRQALNDLKAHLRPPRALQSKMPPAFAVGWSGLDSAIPRFDPSRPSQPFPRKLPIVIGCDGLNALGEGA